MTMTQLDLQQHIALELQANPFLMDDLELDELEEIDQNELQELDSDDLELSEPEETEFEIRVEDFMDDSLPPFGDHTYGDDDEDGDRRVDLAQEVSFHDYLIEQLHLHRLPPDDRAVCELILGNLNDDGFLVLPVSRRYSATSRRTSTR
jgi:RNA polymerase sigma-54 factor